MVPVEGASALMPRVGLQAQAVAELAVLREDHAAGQEASRGLQDELGHAQSRQACPGNSAASMLPCHDRLVQSCAYQLDLFHSYGLT